MVVMIVFENATSRVSAIHLPSIGPLQNAFDLLYLIYETLSIRQSIVL